MNKEVFEFIKRTAEEFGIEVREADENGAICLDFPNYAEIYIPYDEDEDFKLEFESFEENLYDNIQSRDNDLWGYQFDSLEERIAIYGVTQTLTDLHDRLTDDFEYDFA